MPERTLKVRHVVSQALLGFIDHLEKMGKDGSRLRGELLYWAREAELGEIGYVTCVVDEHNPAPPSLREAMERDVAPSREYEPMREKAMRDPEFRRALVAGAISSLVVDDFEAAEKILREYLKGLGR